MKSNARSILLTVLVLIVAGGLYLILVEQKKARLPGPAKVELNSGGYSDPESKLMVEIAEEMIKKTVTQVPSQEPKIPEVKKLDPGKYSDSESSFIIELANLLIERTQKK